MENFPQIIEYDMTPSPELAWYMAQAKNLREYILVRAEDAERAGRNDLTAIAVMIVNSINTAFENSIVNDENSFEVPLLENENKESVVEIGKSLTALLSGKPFDQPPPNIPQFLTFSSREGFAIKSALPGIHTKFVKNEYKNGETQTFSIKLIFEPSSQASDP